MWIMVSAWSWDDIIGGYYIQQNLDWGEHFMGAIEAISGFIEYDYSIP